MRRTSRPVAEKDLKVHSVEDYPYMVVRKYGEPVYFRTFSAARAQMIKDLDRLDRELGHALGAADVTEAISATKGQVDALGAAGGHVDGLVDPYTATRYRAELVKR